MYCSLFPGIIFFWWPGTTTRALLGHRGAYVLEPWRPIIYPFKAVIPVTAFLLLVQGVSELLKSVYAWKRGVWV
jgi:TRAP-type mannitol/chloroaromatic compound transport system permease small subunit